MSQSLAVLDDDKVFAQTLSRRLTKKGFNSEAFYQLDDLCSSKENWQYLVLDMNLGSQSVIPALPTIREYWSNAKIIILTGYGSIATTVAAMKNGADDYLTKPLDFSHLLYCLDRQSVSTSTPQEFSQLSAAQLQWEHIQRVLSHHKGNISAAARDLNMHRRTLQRKLNKRPQW